MAPLQKRALYGLLVSLALTAAFVIVLVLQGDPTAFDRDEHIRMVMYAAMVGVPLAFLILIQLTLKKPTQLDERDRAIIARSKETQWMAIIFSLAAWTIALTEVFHQEGQIPVPYLTLIFVSVLIISSLGQAVGILLGYWRANRDV